MTQTQEPCHKKRPPFLSGSLFCNHTLFCFFLICQSLESIDSQDQRQDDKQACQHDTCYAPADANACAKALEVCDQGLYKGCDGYDQHEYHREQEHFVVFADFSKPGGNSKKSDGCQQLVGCTEQRPDFGITGQAKADAEYYGDNG